MPTYQYACTNAECGNRFDLVQSFTDPSASECPLCGSPVRKVFSPVGVVFKGSGFYRTDSRASNGDGKATSGEGKSGESKGSESKGSESKGSESNDRPKKESSPSSGSDGKSAGTSSSSSESGASAGSGTSAARSKPAGKAATPA